MPKLDLATQKTVWFTTLSQAATTVIFWPVPLRDLPRWIEHRGRAVGLQLDPDAAKLIADRVEGNLLAAKQELDKLSLLDLPNPISAVSLLTTIMDQSRFNPFDLGDALLAGDRARAAHLLARLREEGAEVILILWVLSRELRLLASLDDPAAVERLPVPKGRKPLYARAARRAPSAHWLKLLGRCAQIDRSIKGVAQGEPWQMLDRVMLAACGIELTMNTYKTLEELMTQLGQAARQAARQLARVTTADKNRALLAIAEALRASTPALMAANAVDVANAHARGLDAAMIDRLMLSPQGIEQMAEGVRQVANLPDPIGEITDMVFRPTGIQVGHMRVPLGVVGIIYESRPNVTIDAAALCLKSGNATILRGGSEVAATNVALADCIRRGLVAGDLPVDAVQIVPTQDRAAVTLMLGLYQFIDVMIPRGGKGLVELVTHQAKMPVIKHLDGVCHVFVDEAAALDKAVAVAVNAKTHRYGVCNAMETLLVHAAVAAQFLPMIAPHYFEKGVELRGCPRTQAILGATIKAATVDDWYAEYLGPILAVRVVDTLDEAINHIETYGSHHTDAIMTEHFSTARRFLREVDSASVMVNASTRFADGFEYGLGAEIGISTDKIHARGPVGLQGLTSNKYIVLGDGHIRV
ncbi:MAG: hypothetical protein B7Y53_05945 [Halothiobacillus sp. 28-55-5]|nr:MAG: hypothetical protein B7Y53_05945 [Halothiobacillus sp. 28-55-5]